MGFQKEEHKRFGSTTLEIKYRREAKCYQITLTFKARREKHVQETVGEEMVGNRLGRKSKSQVRL